MHNCHHLIAASWRAVVDRFDTAKVLGVTATPDRGDEVALGHVMPHLAYEYGIADGIRDGVLCPIAAKAIDCPSVDLSTVRVTQQAHGRDLAVADLEAALTKDEATMLAVLRPIADLAGTRPTLVFGPSVRWAHEYRRMMGRVVGPDLCGSLDGTATQEERADVLGRYERGEVRFLFNCQLLTEGFDAPATACVVIARPTKSRALFAQAVGRGTRIAEGKTDLLVLTLHPSGEMHDLAKVVDLFDGKGLDEADREAADRAIMSGEDALRVMSRAAEAAEARRLARERDTGQRVDATVRARIRTIDLFGSIGLDEVPGDAKGPRATDRQREVLAKITGREIGERELSRRQAAVMLDAVADRRKRGLCTLKQARQLAKHGLRTDLTFDEAGAVMTVLAENGWRMTPSIAERFAPPVEAAS